MNKNESAGSSFFYVPSSCGYGNVHRFSKLIKVAHAVEKAAHATGWILLLASMWIFVFMQHPVITLNMR